MNRLPKRLKLLLILFAGLLLLSACSGGSATKAGVPLPAFLDNAQAHTLNAYHYAMENPGELEKYPCYCGCESLGHTSNRSCYIKDSQAGDSLIWDAHAAGCAVCVDITTDVMRMRTEGWNSSGIRAYIDSKYSAFGPPTHTPLPEE